jgi:hypothetical protein
MEQFPQVIELSWDGPFSIEDAISTMHRGQDYGVYQLYGTHNVLGPDTLLYIGKAQQRPFGQRIREHRDEWIEWEPSVVNVYLGRIGATAIMTRERWSEWEEQIDRVERLLIFFCAPPYNSAGLKRLPDLPPTVLLNHRRRHRLPLEVSTYLISTSIGSTAWKVYGEDEAQQSAEADV